MDHESDDVVQAATGTLVTMNELASRLRDAGIECRIVGDDLATGLGSAIPGSVEVWVLSADASRAAAIVANLDQPRETHPSPSKFPHPESDPKPDHSRGPHRPPERHRPNP